MLLYQSELKIAIEAAKEAAIALRKRNNIVIESQKEKDLKLSSDKMSEKIIIDKLQKLSIPYYQKNAGKLILAMMINICGL